MIERARNYSIRLLERWTDFIGHHSFLVLFLSVLATAGVLIYTLNHFRIDTELTDMISEKLPYRKLEKEFQSAFPQFKETIVVVIDAGTPEAARLQREKMAERLKKETGLFKGVYAPGSGEFFERNGLLYLSVKDLEALSDNLASAQPLLGLISKDLTLRGLFSVVERIVSQQGDIEEKTKLVPFFDRLAQAIESSASNQPKPVSWQELILGKEVAAEASRQFIILDPVLDYATFSGGEAGIEAIYRIRDELSLHEASGVKVRLTGDILCCSCQEGKRKKSSFVKTAGYKTVLILETPLPVNPITDSHLPRRISRQWRTLNLSVIIIRYVPMKRDHPSSFIQIPKFSERPCIVPHEVHDGLHVVARASLVENQ